MTQKNEEGYPFLQALCLAVLLLCGIAGMVVLGIMSLREHGVL